MSAVVTDNRLRRTSLLQTARVSAGTSVVAARPSARVRLPQAELDVVAQSHTVPNPGNPVRVTVIDGITVTVQPTFV